MKSRIAVHCVALAVVAFSATSPELHAQSTDTTQITGLWKAVKYFGPNVYGPLIIQKNGTSYTAELMDYTVPMRIADGEMLFNLPDNRGKFRGKLQRDGSIHGLWFPGPSGWITPVKLTPRGATRWSGTVTPFEDLFSFSLLVKKRPDGSFAAQLINPEREVGAWMGVTSIVRTGNDVQLMGRRGGQIPGVVADGKIDTEQQVMRLYFPYRGGSYDFKRDNDSLSGYYPRGRNPGRYTYREPLALDDGWPPATPEEVGIDRAAIERAVQQLLDLRMDTVDVPLIHGLIVARKGKLILEEYFHGENREKLHDTRSASKTVSATIIGAAMQAGTKLQLSTPVYEVFNGGTFPPGLEPRKRAMTLEHLMTMSSGFFCDDGNDDAPGNEETQWNQKEEPDFYKFALRLPMATAPGDVAVYCSINPNLALGMAGVAANESPFWLFDRLVATPLGINRYAWGTDPAGHPYGGGGMKFRLRDFAKFAQLMLDGGTWRGKRILSREFVNHASSSLYKLGRSKRDYGLLWWPQDYPYRGRKVHAVSALGLGGQQITFFPELDLVIASFGANYVSDGDLFLNSEFIPKYILSAIR